MHTRTHSHIIKQTVAGQQIIDNKKPKRMDAEKGSNWQVMPVCTWYWYLDLDFEDPGKNPTAWLISCWEH
jgi:hypothetical protein